MALAGTERSVQVRVPGKLNLHLAVGPLRSDDYHELVTVFHAVDLLDEVTATESDRLTLRVTGDGAAQVPDGALNLAWQAAELLGAAHGVPAHAALHIRKAIPVGGGMAGGSADAAAALVACAALWQIDLTKVELAELAAQLGSDVPFALHGGTALGVGRGEQVNPVLATGRFWWVLALADIEISARTAYAELDRLRTDGAAPPPLGGPDDVLDALRAGDPHLLAPLLGNDLQAAALSLAPRLRRTLRTGAELGALAGIVSGSGPTCAFLCADAEAATDLVAALSAEDVCRTVRLASGPVLGTRVIG